MLDLMDIGYQTKSSGDINWKWGLGPENARGARDKNVAFWLLDHTENYNNK